MHLWFSCKKFTVRLKVKDEVITDAAPIVRRFKGQSLQNLETWVLNKGWGPIRKEEI
jgi:hypothetical protein